MQKWNADSVITYFTEPSVIVRLALIEHDIHNHVNRLTTVIVSRFMLNLQSVEHHLSEPISTIGSQGPSIEFRHPLGSLGASLDFGIPEIHGNGHDHEVEEEGQEVEVATGWDAADEHSVIKDVV